MVTLINRLFTLILSTVDLTEPVFVIGNLFLNRTTSTFIYVENQIVDSINHIGIISGFINLQSAKRENLYIDFLNSFLFFCYYVGASELIEIKKKSQIASQIQFLSKFSKNTFIRYNEDVEAILTPVTQKLYQFKPHIGIPASLYDPAKKIIDEYIQDNKKDKQ